MWAGVQIPRVWSCRAFHGLMVTGRSTKMLRYVCPNCSSICTKGSGQILMKGSRVPSKSMVPSKSRSASISRVPSKSRVPSTSKVRAIRRARPGECPKMVPSGRWSRPGERPGRAIVPAARSSRPCECPGRENVPAVRLSRPRDGPGRANVPARRSSRPGDGRPSPTPLPHGQS